VDQEKLIAKITEDLNVCEEYLKREARLDFVLRILEDLIDLIELAKKENIPLGDLEEKARLLYHRASTLVTLIEQGVKK